MVPNNDTSKLRLFYYIDSVDLQIKKEVLNGARHEIYLNVGRSVKFSVA